jgi:hypothetical protein
MPQVNQPAYRPWICHESHGDHGMGPKAWQTQKELSCDNFAPYICQSLQFKRAFSFKFRGGHSSPDRLGTLEDPWPFIMRGNSMKSLCWPYVAGKVCLALHDSADLSCR